MPETLSVGAVAYHPRVVGIWDAFAAWFAARGTPVLPVLFDSYEEQLEALFGGDIQVAWNTNLAYVEAQRRTGGGCDMLAMRDNDRDWRSHMVVRDDADAHMARLVFYECLGRGLRRGDAVGLHVGGAHAA